MQTNVGDVHQTMIRTPREVGQRREVRLCITEWQITVDRFWWRAIRVSSWALWVAAGVGDLIIVTEKLGIYQKVALWNITEWGAVEQPFWLIINRAEKQRRTAHPEILLLGNFSRDTTLNSFPTLLRVFTIDYNFFTLSSRPAPSGLMSDTPSPPVAGFK